MASRTLAQKASTPSNSRSSAARSSALSLDLLDARPQELALFSQALPSLRQFG